MSTYKTVITTVNKVSIEISREQMWRNFSSNWADLLWDDYTGTGSLHDIKRVADILLNGEPLNKSVVALRGLFRDGLTFQLMGDAMNEIANGKDVLLEIVITDEGHSSVVIDHQHIDY